jgi:hypothetical protein
MLDQPSLSLDLWSVTSVRAGDESLHAAVNYYDDNDDDDD